MALSTVIFLLSILAMLPLTAFAIVMLAVSSVKLEAIELGGTQDENNLWN